MALKEGNSILNNKYQILRLIGEGGMARVWLAEEPKFGNRRVAIKEPRTDLPPDAQQELARRYRLEISLAPQLERGGVPHVVRTYTLEELPDSTQLLVMEYMEGGSLAELIASHPEGLPLDRALAIAQALLQALDAFHNLPMAPVHRDVKPENVLFDARGEARLSDFGLAQLPGVSGRTQMLGMAHPGTPMYMAPEQGRSPDPLLPAADLYALGCVLFEMLTGKRYRRERPGTRASALRPEVPGWLDEVLLKTLADDPWDRYREASEVGAALETGDERQEAEEQARREAEEKARRQVAEKRARRKADERPRWQRIGIEMVTIPAGEFLYGKRKKRMHLPEYHLAKTPVTNAQYKAFVDATGYGAPHHWEGGRIPAGQKDHPVVYVGWHHAQAFCSWAECRLPTEMEWEKGARGTDGREYPWGDGWGDGRCNSEEAGINGTTPVGHYPRGASPHGLLDMAGNVWEWCEDKRFLGASRAVRGGSFQDNSGVMRCAYRDAVPHDYWSYAIGFRVASDPLE